MQFSIYMGFPGKQKLCKWRRECNYITKHSVYMRHLCAHAKLYA